MISLPDEVFEGGGRLRKNIACSTDRCSFTFLTVGNKLSFDITRIVNLATMPWSWAKRAFRSKERIAYTPGSLENCMSALIAQIGNGKSLIFQTSGHIALDVTLVAEKPLKRKVSAELKARLSQADECVALIDNKYVGFSIASEELDDGSIRYYAKNRYIQSEVSTPFAPASLTP